MQDELAGCLAAVDNTDIEFATMRPRRAPGAVLERKVVITGPPKMMDLVQAGKLEVLDALVNMLDDPQKDWAAQVLLSALTGQEGREVDTYAEDPAGWRNVFGAQAMARWRAWLEDHQDRLQWDADAKVFVVAG